MIGRSTGRAVSAWTLAVLVTMVVQAGADRRESRELLIQPFLSPVHSQWLIGPVAWIASDDEIDAWMTLRDDARAEEFIAAFWARKDSESEVLVSEIYHRRATQADDDFSEGHVPGRRTDRGTIFILHGPPESTRYEEFHDVTEPEVELWSYPKKAERGLDGRQPKREYRFARRGDLTTFYKAPSKQELERRARTRGLSRN